MTAASATDLPERHGPGRGIPRRAVRAALSTLAAGAAFALAVPAAAKDTLTIGISQFPQNFHPGIESMLAKRYILQMTRREITVYNADWELECRLCTELPSLEKGTARRERTADGEDGIALTYTLLPEAVWGDGTPITTKDVVFSWETGRNERSGFGNLELYQRITSIDVHDEKSFTLHVNKFTCEHAGLSGLELLPAHIEAAHVDDPAEYRHRSAYETDTTNPGLWYGPYRVAAVAPGSHVVLEPNPHWWGDEPAFRRIVVRAIENTAALTANLLSGGIDYIAGELGLTVDQALAFEARAGDRFDFIYKPGLIYEHIDLNLDDPILSDRRVRRALVHALDREAISRQLFQGHQPVAHGQTNPLDTVYDPDVPKYAHDPARAVALLEEAGWAEVRGGIRYNAAGEPLRLDFMTTAGNRTRELIQQAIQSQWRRVGVDARIRNQPPRVFFGETVSRRAYGHMAMYAWISSPKSIPRTTLHSTQVPTPENGWSGQNYPGFRNPEMDRVLDDVERICDEPSQTRLWSELQRIYAEELPAIPLYFRADPYIVPKWLEGIVPTGHQFTTALWVEHWRARP